VKTTIPASDYNPLAGAVIDDPYPYYRVLRAEHPVHHNRELDLWTLSRFADVQMAARDWGTFSSVEGVVLDNGLTLLEQLKPGNVLVSDPPQHDVVRKVVHRQFTPAHVKAVEHAAERDAAELIDRLLDARDVDLAVDLGWPLPTAAIAAVLGLPAVDVPWLTLLLLDYLDGEPDSSLLPERSLAAARQLCDYVAEQLGDRRRHARDDLLSAMVAAESAGQIHAEESLGLAFVLLTAGIDTTAALIMAAIELLAPRPAARARLIAEPTALAPCIEEVVRYASPLQGLARTTTADVELHGVTIPQGARVWLAFGAANRDAARFPDADVFDPFRSPLRNLGFGEGIHHCIGAPLARLVGRVALEQFLLRVASVTVSSCGVRLYNHAVRSWASLPAVVE